MSDEGPRLQKPEESVDTNEPEGRGGNESRNENGSGKRSTPGRRNGARVQPPDRPETDVRQEGTYF